MVECSAGRGALAGVSRNGVALAPGRTPVRDPGGPNPADRPDHCAPVHPAGAAKRLAGLRKAACPRYDIHADSPALGACRQGEGRRRERQWKQIQIPCERDSPTMRRRGEAVDKPGGPCFVDTSAFYALLDADDSHHRKAVGLFSQLAHSRARLLTSNHVLFETYSLVQSRLGQWMAQSWLGKLNMRVERTTAEDEQRAVQIVLEYRDKEFSLVDASSFALMERLGLRRAIAFDPHFRQYGRFMVLQQPAGREGSSR